MQHCLNGALAAGAVALSVGLAHALDLAPPDSDSEPDRMDRSELDAKFGTLTRMSVQAFYQLLATGIIIIVAMLIGRATSV